MVWDIGLKCVWVVVKIDPVLHVVSVRVCANVVRLSGAKKQDVNHDPRALKHTKYQKICKHEKYTRIQKYNM